MVSGSGWLVAPSDGVRFRLAGGAVFYLIEAKGLTDYAQAAARVSGLELGGLVGSLLAGRLSDKLIGRAQPGEGHVGKRLQKCKPV